MAEVTDRFAEMGTVEVKAWKPGDEFTDILRRIMREGLTIYYPVAPWRVFASRLLRWWPWASGAIAPRREIPPGDWVLNIVEMDE